MNDALTQILEAVQLQIVRVPDARRRIMDLLDPDWRSRAEYAQAMSDELRQVPIGKPK